jgi:hypothetical protein
MGGGYEWVFAKMKSAATGARDAPQPRLVGITLIDDVTLSPRPGMRLLQNYSE